MKNYQKIENTCRKQSDLFSTFVDDFLICYCAEREGLEKQFAKKLGQFRSVIQDMPENWPFWLMSQYTAFRLFKKNGFAKKYINHPKILSRSDEEKSLLSLQVEHPWRYAFCSVKSNPAPHFFNMVDVLTSEEFLLYSKGMTEILEQHGQMQMFFYLLGFNGQCWQTYGPNAFFRGIVPSDLLFFSRQLNSDIMFMNQIPQLIERDPLPWALLWRGGELPLTVHGDDQIIMNCSEYHEENFEPDEYVNAFKIERKYPLYKMSLKRWGKVPHFAEAFYHKKKNRLILSAMTDRGYSKLIEAFGKMGFELPENPENRVTLAMLETAKGILGRSIKLNPYEESFSRPQKQEQSAELKKINKFLMLFVNAHNAGEEIDIDRFATMAGIDTETAHAIAGQAMKTIDGMPGRS